MMARSKLRKLVSSWTHRGDKSDNDADTVRTQPCTSQGPKIATEVKAQVPQALLLADIDATPTAADPGTDDPPPVIDSGTQQDQTFHQRLWDDAYDSLEEEKETTKFVEGYVKTLAKVLEEKANDTSPAGASDVSVELKGCRKEAAETSSAGATDILAALKDRTRRQEYMRKLVDDGIARVEKSSRITKAVGDVADTILLTKPIIDVVMSIPQAAPAALPWAGFCVGLQMLSNPAKEARSNIEGMKYVVSRMLWYSALTEHLLNTDDADMSFKSTLQQLEQKVIELYKAILLYQMKSVCSYYRHQSLEFLENLFIQEKWVNDLATVQKAESDLLQDWDEYDQVKASKVRDGLLSHTKGMENQLRTIHQDLREFIDYQQKIQADGEVKECLQDLRVINPQDDMKRIEDEKEELFDDAYKWILKDEKYTAFITWDESDGPPCRLLWINSLQLSSSRNPCGGNGRLHEQPHNSLRLIDWG